MQQNRLLREKQQENNRYIYGVQPWNNEEGIAESYLDYGRISAIPF